MNGNDKITKAFKAKGYDVSKISYSKQKWNGLDYEGGWEVEVSFDVESTDESICDQIDGIEYDEGSIEAGEILADKISDVLKMIKLIPVNVKVEFDEDNI